MLSSLALSGWKNRGPLHLDCEPDPRLSEWQAAVEQIWPALERVSQTALRHKLEAENTNRHTTKMLEKLIVKLEEVFHHITEKKARKQLKMQD